MAFGINFSYRLGRKLDWDSEEGVVYLEIQRPIALLVKRATEGWQLVKNRQLAYSEIGILTK